MSRHGGPVVLEAAGREVTITNPQKVFFPQTGYTKLDLAKYYLAVAGGALRGLSARPIVLKRYVNGADKEPFFQKRAPESLPDWMETVELRFPSGRTAREIVVRDAAQLLWIVNLGCIDLNPHPVRADDLEHPDELRVDLDPGPGVAWDDVRKVTLVLREVLDEYGLRGWPKTSGSRGMHVNIRIEPRWGFDQVRRAALALAREVERRAPDLATSKWWKEERHGVFLDYNQNAKDRTVASAWSVRPTPDARVSMPIDWDEVPDCDPARYTLATAPARFAERGDASAGIDSASDSLDRLLELSAEQEAAGHGDAPWPPHYKKGSGEPPRVAPSRKKGASKRVTSKNAADATRSDGTKAVRSETKRRQTTRSKAVRSKTTSLATASSATTSSKITSPETKRRETRRSSTGRRRSTQPLITVSKAKRKEDALEGLERWKARHPAAAAHLRIEDILVDSMRGRSSLWTRIRINLRNVPEEERPAEEPPDPDYDPWADAGSGRRRQE